MSLIKGVLVHDELALEIKHKNRLDRDRRLIPGSVFDSILRHFVKGPHFVSVCTRLCITPDILRQSNLNTLKVKDARLILATGKDILIILKCHASNNQEYSVQFQEK